MDYNEKSDLIFNREGFSASFTSNIHISSKLTIEQMSLFFPNTNFHISPHRKYAIYRMREDKPVLLRTLTNERAELLLNSQVLLNRFKILRNQIIQVEMNFAEIIEAKKDNFKNNFQSTTIHKLNHKDQHTLTNINRLCKNYAFSYFNAVELMEKQICKDYNLNKKEKFEPWEELRKSYYNSYFEYRFVYQLRNFCHITNPINSIYEANGQFTAFCKKADLKRLSQFNKDAFKDDWLRLGENFNCLPIVLASMRHLLNLADDHLKINKEIFLPSAISLWSELAQFRRFIKVGLADTFLYDSIFVLEMPLDTAKMVIDYYK